MFLPFYYSFYYSTLAASFPCFLPSTLPSFLPPFIHSSFFPSFHPPFLPPFLSYLPSFLSLLTKRIERACHPILSNFQCFSAAENRDIYFLKGTPPLSVFWPRSVLLPWSRGRRAAGQIRTQWNSSSE